MGADFHFNPPDEGQPEPSVTSRVMDIENRLGLMEKENEELHAQINKLEAEKAAMNNAIAVLRTHETVEPHALLQRLDAWRNRLSGINSKLSPIVVEVASEMTDYIQELAVLVKHQTRPLPGVRK